MSCHPWAAPAARELNQNRFNQKDKLPPCSPEAERGVLGCGLLGVTSRGPLGGDARLKQPGGHQPKFTAEELLTVLGNERLTTSEWSSLAKEEMGLSNASFFLLLKELRQAGQIQKSAIDKKWEKVRRRTTTPYRESDE